MRKALLILAAATLIVLASAALPAASGTPPPRGNDLKSHRFVKVTPDGQLAVTATAESHHVLLLGAWLVATGQTPGATFWSNTYFQSEDGQPECSRGNGITVTANDAGNVKGVILLEDLIDSCGLRDGYLTLSITKTYLGDPIVTDDGPATETFEIGSPD